MWIPCLRWIKSWIFTVMRMKERYISLSVTWWGHQNLMLLSNSLLKWQSRFPLWVFLYRPNKTQSRNTQSITLSLSTAPRTAVQSQLEGANAIHTKGYHGYRLVLYLPSENTTWPFHRSNIHLPLNCSHKACGDAIVTIKGRQGTQRWG